MTGCVLFLVNGLGLGNSTRCHAIIQRLAKKGVRCVVVTSGNGAWYFRGRPEVSAIYEIESFFYASKGGKISIALTLGSAFTFARIQMRNAARIAEILEIESPNLAVIDSMYVTGPFRKKGIPIAALNNSDAIYRAKSFFGDLPSSVRAQFYAIECSDYYWHKRFPDLVISPSLVPELGRAKDNVQSVSPIVRAGCVPSDGTKDGTRVVVMLSGSAFGSQVTFSESDYPCQIDVVGREAPDGWRQRENIRFLGRVRDTQDLMRDADLVIVNGGFSAVSEAYAMAKPVVVVPVPNHAEQWFNGRMIEHLGVGMIGGEASIEQHLFDALDRLGDLRGAYGKISLPVDGAERAAEILLSHMG
jgi:UDP:flavonoid glycosyltransferase YjiC (YdhE family)